MAQVMCFFYAYTGGLECRSSPGVDDNSFPDIVMFIFRITNFNYQEGLMYNGGGHFL